MKAHMISNNEETHCCPSCNAPLTAATGVDTEDKPEKGDISVCFYCGEILTYNSDLTLSKISSNKLKEIKNEAPDVFLNITRMSRLFKEKAKKKNN